MFDTNAYLFELDPSWSQPHASYDDDDPLRVKEIDMSKADEILHTGETFSYTLAALEENMLVLDQLAAELEAISTEV